MTRKAGPQGAQVMLKEPMIAQEEVEDVKSAERLYLKDEPSSTRSPDTKEAQNELT